MPISATETNGQTDVWVTTPHGRVFVRVWSTQSTEADCRNAVPIILLHDSLGCVDLWRDFPAALAQRTGRTVIAYDRLGFGRSDALTEAPSHAFIADEAETVFMAVREQLDIERFIVFGHSVGGSMAIHCAARFGDNCLALVTEAALVFVEDRTLQGILDAREQFSDSAQVDRLRRLHGDKSRWILDAWMDTWLSPAFASWSLEPVLPRVKCPVLAIHGADDEYGSERHPKLIARLAAGSAGERILPDTRHVPHRERRQAVLEMLTEFLRPIA